MTDPTRRFLLGNPAPSFYLVGAIWAVEVDIFRTWKLVNPRDFPTVQNVPWHKLPYWVFAPLGLALIGSIVLIWYHPAGIARLGNWGESQLPRRLNRTH